MLLESYQGIILSSVHARKDRQWQPAPQQPPVHSDHITFTAPLSHHGFSDHGSHVSTEACRGCALGAAAAQQQQQAVAQALQPQQRQQQQQQDVAVVRQDSCG